VVYNSLRNLNKCELIVKATPADKKQIDV